VPCVLLLTLKGYLVQTFDELLRRFVAVGGQIEEGLGSGHN